MNTGNHSKHCPDAKSHSGFCKSTLLPTPVAPKLLGNTALGTGIGTSPKLVGM